MAVIPYMPLYIADYLADAAHLSTLEHGAYLLLIMGYWQRGKPLPASNDRLANVARMSNEQWLSVRTTIAEFFTEADGFWHHKRIDAELVHFRAKSAQARAAGLLSAERKRNVRSTPVEHPLNDTDTDTDTEEEEKNKHTSARSAVAAVRSVRPISPIDVEIERWYRDEFYPIFPLKKSGKEGLAAAKKQLTTPELRAAALAGLQAQLPELMAREASKRPYPASWINGHRWKDEIVSDVPNGGFVQRALGGGGGYHRKKSFMESIESEAFRMFKEGEI